MGRTASQCALAGCDREVPVAEPGRPPRRYCSAEHHAQAAGAHPRRPGAVPPAGPEQNPTAPAALEWPHRAPDPDKAARAPAAGLSGLPPVRPPARGRPPGGGLRGRREDAALRSRLSERDMARARRRRIAVAVASAGVLIAGIGLTGGEQPRDPVAPVPGPPSDPHADWTARAQVTLASLRNQLDSIVETEQVWTSEIAEQYDGQDTPPAVTAMLAQKAELEQQIATLTAQLAVAEELHRVREQVSGSEDRLAALDEVIDEHIPEQAQAHTPEQQALLDQRDLLAASLADAHADAARLAEGVDAAQAAPLPTPVDHSTPLVEAVRDLDDDGDREGPGSAELPPAVAFGRDEETRPSSPPTSGEPEDPEDSQPTDQPDEQSGPPPGDSPPPTSPPPAHEPPAEDLGDTVDNTLDGVTGLVGNDDEGAGDNEGEGKGAGAGDERSGSAEDRGGPGKNDRPDLGDRVDDTLDPVTEPITDLIGGDDSDEPDDSDGPGDNAESDDSDDPASSDDDRRDNDERDGVSGGDDQSGRDDQSDGRDDGASPGTDDVRDGENSPDDAASERGSEGLSAADLSDLDLDLNEVNDRIGSLAGDLADDIVDTLIPLDVEAVVGGMSDFADSEGTEEEDSTAAEDENSDDDTPSGNSDSDSGDDEPDRSGSDNDGSGDGGDDGDEGDSGDGGDSSGSSGDNGSADEGGDSQDDGDTNSDNDGSDA